MPTAAVLSGSVVVGAATPAPSVVKAWAASRLALAPQYDSALPAGAPDAGPVNTSLVFGANGAWRLTVPDNTLDYWISSEYNGHIGWEFRPHVAAAAGGGGGGALGRQTIGAATGAITLDVSSYSAFALTLTGYCTLTISDPPAGATGNILVELTQGGAGNFSFSFNDAGGNSVPVSENDAVGLRAGQKMLYQFVNVTGVIDGSTRRAWIGLGVAHSTGVTGGNFYATSPRVFQNMPDDTSIPLVIRPNDGLYQGPTDLATMFEIDGSNYLLWSVDSGGGIAQSFDRTSLPLATGGTINTTRRVSCKAPAADVTGIILSPGYLEGHMFTLINESLTSSITFDAAATSNVADGAATPLPPMTARHFSFSYGTNKWYRSA